MTLSCSKCSVPYRREEERFICPVCEVELRFETVGGTLCDWLGAFTIAPDKQRALEIELRKLAKKGEK